MAEPIRTFVVLDAGVNQEDVERALPKTEESRSSALVNGIDEAWVRLHETANDLLVIVCAGQSEPVLNLIDNAVAERPRRPVVVLSYGSPNGFTRRVFAAGADDVVMLPGHPRRAAVRAAEGGCAQGRCRGRRLVHPCAAHLRTRPEGRHGQDADLDLARGRARRGRKGRRARRPRLQFGDVGLTMGLRPSRRSSTSLAPAAPSTRRSSTAS